MASRFVIQGLEKPQTEAHASLPAQLRRFVIQVGGKLLPSKALAFVQGQKPVGNFFGRRVFAKQLWIPNNRRPEWIMWSADEYFGNFSSLSKCQRHLFHLKQEEEVTR